MEKGDSIKLFEDKKIRSVWNDEEEEWYFSVVDVIDILTDSANPTDYLKKLRKRDTLLGDYVGTNCPQVAMSTKTEIKKMKNNSPLYKTLAETNNFIILDTYTMYSQVVSVTTQLELTINN